MSGTSVISRLSSENEASLVRGLLESYGIPVTVSSDSLARAVYPMNIGEICLSVPDELEAEALRILEAHRGRVSLHEVHSLSGEGGPIGGSEPLGGGEGPGADKEPDDGHE